ncbi:hypothetical protein [Streptomyces sp. NPDC058701]|uniref:hypothetical protein n=1 Tax=Streptomyces sp. NPDC058701 TaxID=3346608 RepID=UPI0036581670
MPLPECGKWINPAWLTEQFAKLVELAGLPQIRLPDLRHIAASLIVDVDLDVKIAYETLGHSEASVTHHILSP